MNEKNSILLEKKLDLSLTDIDAKIIYHIYHGFKLNTLIVDFEKNRRTLSTLDGYKDVRYVGNTYTPLPLSKQTMQNYRKFKRTFPLALGINPSSIAFLSTGVDMDNLAICEKSYERIKVCCLATAGAKGNALRTGVDKANYIEYDGSFRFISGTINVIILTNVTLSASALARAIITITEAKTTVLQDLDIRSTSSPDHQATGTGTDNAIIVSGKMGKPLLLTSGHTKIGELIATSTKTAVTEALIKHDKL